MKFFTWLYNQFYPPKYKVQLHVGVVGARENLPSEEEILEFTTPALTQPPDKTFLTAFWLDITDVHGNKLDRKNQKLRDFRGCLNNALMKINQEFGERRVPGFPIEIDFTSGVLLWPPNYSILINFRPDTPFNTIKDFLNHCYQLAILKMQENAINFRAVDEVANIRLYNQRNSRWDPKPIRASSGATLMSLMPVTTLNDYLANEDKRTCILKAQENSEAAFKSIKDGDYDCAISLDKLSKESKIVVVFYNAGNTQQPNYRFNFYQDDPENINMQSLKTTRLDPIAKCPILALQEFNNIDEFLKFLDKFKKQEHSADDAADIPKPSITR